MSLIHCRECAHEISSEATACPHCGCPTRPRKKIKPVSFALLLLGIAPSIFGGVLVWDSLLWLLPEPYDVPAPDWKEFGIGLGILTIAIAFSILGCAKAAE